MQPRGSKRLFLKKEPPGSSGPPRRPGLTGEAASIDSLCASIEKSSLRTGAGKRSSGGGAEDNGGTADLDGDGDVDERWGWKRGRPKRGWKGGRVQKKRSVLTEELDDDVSPDYVPNKRRPDSRILRKTTQPSSVYTQPDQKVRGTGPEARRLFRP